ncbi:Hypothetical predicted protein [Cloeon dipterum]|uniref:Ion transport domain-containing protein n=1 Tax=Cloeon dipterum TaxID=197152 RepID=A0A8S1CVU6_9INSE|nr:Hypothetical predicted protein [Cloeon dipterum]
MPEKRAETKIVIADPQLVPPTHSNGNPPVPGRKCDQKLMMSFRSAVKKVRAAAKLKESFDSAEVSVDGCKEEGCKLDADRHFKQIVKAINGDTSHSYLISCEHKKEVYTMTFNSNSFTLLQGATTLRRLDVMKDFLKHPEVDVNQISADSFGLTALHLAALANFEDGVRLLVDSGAVVDALDAHGFTPLHHASLHKNTEAVRALIRAGASLKRTAPHYFDFSALSMVLRKTPKAVDAVNERLDASISFSQDEKDEDGDKVTLVFDLQEWQCEDGPVSLLHVFAKEHDLEHPLLRVLLEENWRRAKCIYYWRIGFGILFLASIAAYVYTKGEPPWQIYPLLTLAICDFVRKAVSFVSFANSPAAFKFWKTVLTYLQSFDNYCEIFCYIGAWAFWRGDQELKDSIGPMVFLACWFKFIVMIGEFRMFGLYIDMYYFVLKSFVKLILSFGVYLLGFIICFCMYFRDEEHFSSLFTALVKVAAMMVGELEYGDLVKSISRQNGTEGSFEMPWHVWLVGANGFYSVFPMACILIFLVAVPIVLMSLLLGIVVQDVNTIKNQAHSFRLARKAELVEYCLITTAHVSRFIKSGCCDSKPCWSFWRCIKPNNKRVQEYGKTVSKEYAFDNEELPVYMHDAYEIATRNSMNDQ